MSGSLKEKLMNEGGQLVTICHQLKWQQLMGGHGLPMPLPLPLPLFDDRPMLTMVLLTPKCAT